MALLLCQGRTLLSARLAASRQPPVAAPARAAAAASSSSSSSVSAVAATAVPRRTLLAGALAAAPPTTSGGSARGFVGRRAVFAARRGMAEVTESPALAAVMASRGPTKAAAAVAAEEQPSSEEMAAFEKRMQQLEASLGDMLKEGDADGALGKLQAAIQGDNDPELMDRYADLLVAVDRVPEALEVLDRALASGGSAMSDAQRGSLLQRRGECLYLTGAPGDTAAVLREALRLNPDAWLASRRLGHMAQVTVRKAQSKQERDEALAQSFEHYNNALRVEPEDTDALFGRASAYLTASKPEEAMADLKRLLELDPEYSPAYHKIGECALLLQQWAPAVTHLTRFIDTAPSWYSTHGSKGRTADPEAVLADVFWKRGMAYVELTDYEMARDSFDRVLAMSGRYLHDRALQGRARTHLLQKKYWDCIEDCTNALKINPKLVQAYRDRSEAYKAVGRADEAAQDMLHYNIISRERIWRE